MKIKKYRIIKLWKTSGTICYHVQKKSWFWWGTLSTDNGEYSSFLSFNTESEAEGFIKDGCPNPYSVHETIVKYVEVPA